MRPASRRIGPRRRSRWGGPLPAAAVAAGVLLSALFIIWYVVPPRHANDSPPAGGSGSTPTGVVVDGFDLIVDYWTSNASDTGYLSSPECDGCPLNLTPGTAWAFTWDLTNRDSSHAHNLTAVALGAPFSLLTLSPGLPVLLQPGSTVAVRATILLPSTPGDYFITGSLDVS